MKNVLLMALSTVGFGGEEKSLKRMHYKYEEDRKGEMDISGYYQLEPVPQLLQNYILKNRGERLDEIIMLCTPKVKEEFSLYYDKEKDCYYNKLKENAEERGETTAVEFFTKRIEETVGKIELSKIDIDEQNPEKGISQAIFKIHEWKKEDLCLWLDTHGGPRGMQMVLDAVVFLLKEEGIVPEDIFSTIMEKDDPNKIVSQKKEFYIFDFVSGMQEFFYYGRAKGLKEYFRDEMRQKKELKSLLGAVEKTAEAIQLCNMDEFKTQISCLNCEMNKYKKVDSYLSVFLERMKKEYKDLFSDSLSYLDIVVWCKEKEFYQQALTVIESRMPEDMKNDGVFCFKPETQQGEGALIKISSNYPKKEYDATQNYILEQYIYKGLKGHLWDTKSLSEAPDISNKLLEGKIVTEYKISDSPYMKYTEVRQGEKYVRIQTNVPKQYHTKLYRLFFLHMALKKQRNKTNHAATKESKGVKRASLEELLKAIETYVKLYKELKDAAGNEQKKL